MRYLSVCSGIEAATVAWHGLGWEPAAFSEIEKFPSEVLAHHYPTVPNLGDMTKFEEWNLGTIELLVGGTPCQSFSVAGLRKGLDDPRGNLMLTYLAIARRHRPKWLVWENVPGVLSSNGGEDFASLLRGLVELGYGWAYRVLDAQYFGVAQRRRRVFVVGCLGDWRASAAVLFERDSLCGNPAPSREKRKGITCTPEGISGTISRKWSKGTGGPAGDEHYNLMVVHGTQDPITSDIAFPLATNHGQENALVYPIHDKATRYKGGGDTRNGDGAGNGLGVGKETDPSPTLTAGDKHIVAVLQEPLVYEMHPADSRVKEMGDVCQTLTSRWGTGGGNVPITIQSAVRRLTPMECERLQGFPDNYTNIKDKTPDGSRYKALGNSMAVPVMAWIGKRIKEVDELSKPQAA